MSVDVSDAQGLLDAVRYLWRGTRWTKGRERFVGKAVAGYVFGDQGEVRPFGEIHGSVVDAYRRADMEPIERLVVGEYFGLVAFPTDLTGGPAPLVGRVRTSTGRQGKVASRSAVAAARMSGVAAIAGALGPAPLERSMALAPIGDPLDDASLRRHLGLGDDLDLDLLEACLFAAYDLTDRAARADEVRRALDSWKRKWISGASTQTERLVSFGARHAAFAALHVALWNSGTRNDSEPVEMRVPVVLWPATAIDRPRAGRVIVTERWGVIDQADLTADDLVCLCGLVFNGDDVDGSVADFVIPILALPHTASPLTRRAYGLVVWSVVRHLASRGDWRAMELIMAIAAADRLTADLPQFLAWAAHVASLFDHVALAWRLANQADRLIDRQPASAPVRRTVLQVRSGILVRSADSLLDRDPERGLSDLRQSMRYIHEANLSAQASPTAGSIFTHVPVELRLLEAYMVAYRFRSHGFEPRIGHEPSLGSIAAAVATVRDKITDHVAEDDDDLTVLMARVQRLESAIAAAELDDSALGPFLGHEI